MNEPSLDELVDIVVNGNVSEAKSLVNQLLKSGNSPDRIIEEGLLPGLTILGDKYENGQVFLPELFSTGEVAKQVVSILAPYIGSSDTAKKGTIIIGTVEGDVHDIGMNLIAATLHGAGYNVINLGSNVSSDRFIDAARQHGSDVLAMSALLTTTMVKMKTVIELLDRSGLRKNIKVIVGGAPLDDAYSRTIGADAYGRDARDGLRAVQRLLARDRGVKK
jgi:methylmalonyl-CoA mutase cobalamin-binding domain/chain